MTAAPPSIFVIAGPNGAGKTTVAMHVLPKTLGITQFVNADLIAGSGSLRSGPLD